MYVMCSAITGHNVFFVFVFYLGGGGGNLAERNLMWSGRKPQKIIEIFFPEIAANASNFKN